MALNRVNTLAEVTEFQRRLGIEMTSSGLSRIIPDVATLQRMATDGAVAFMDNGLAPTFVGADRICIILQKENDLSQPQGWWVQSLFGPTSIPGIAARSDGFAAGHAALGRWVTNRLPVRFPALATGTTGLFFRPSSLPMVQMAIALFTNGIPDAQGAFRLTFAGADAAGSASGAVVPSV